MKKLLFFDLEFATSQNGVKICEFGFVLVDEEFSILQKGNYIINPLIKKYEWDYRAVRTILTRDRKEYETKASFPAYYDDIVRLIKGADYVLGHTPSSDVKALNDDCQRYNLKSIDFEFIDICLFYKAFNNSKRRTSVQNILENMGIEGDTRNHDAEADAYNTMLETKKMLNELNVTLDEMLYLCPEAIDKNNNYLIESVERAKKDKEEIFRNIINGSSSDNSMKQYSDQKMLFLQFLDNVQPEKDSDKTLKGKKYTISINYEECHFRQMLNIVQLLCNRGATYILKASSADVFVGYDVIDEEGNIKPCSKKRYVEEANEHGSKIEIISFEEFMSILGITEEELNKMPMVPFDFLYREDAVIKDKKTKKIFGKENEGSSKEVKSSSINLGDKFGDLFNDLLKKMDK